MELRNTLLICFIRVVIVGFTFILISFIAVPLLWITGTKDVWGKCCNFFDEIAFNKSPKPNQLN